MTFSHLKQVLDEVAPLGRLFSDAGFRLFLVGGIVRDQWLDEPLDVSSDIDLTTDALPKEIKRIVASFAEDLWMQGEKFGTIGLRAGGRDYEITTHRAESYNSGSRKPAVTFGDNIEVDLSRRDFTVNAMAIELPDGELVDPYAGAVDLAAGVLRTPLSADIAFSDDPLRMLRAARFSTKYSLDPVDELRASATELHERIRIVAIERIGVELQRLLELAHADHGLRFLAVTQVLDEVLCYGEPALKDGVQLRLGDALEIAAALPARWRLRLAGIGLVVFDDAVGVRSLCRRLRLSRHDERAIVAMAEGAIDARSAPNLEAPTLRRWFMQHGSSPHVDDALVLASELFGTGEIEPFTQALIELAAVEPADQANFIGGGMIMAELGIAPGPAIGQAQAFLRECYFEEGPLDQEQQISRLRSWWSAES